MSLDITCGIMVDTSTAFACRERVVGAAGKLNRVILMRLNLSETESFWDFVKLKICDVMEILGNPVDYDVRQRIELRK